MRGLGRVRSHRGLVDDVLGSGGASELVVIQSAEVDYTAVASGSWGSDWPAARAGYAIMPIVGRVISTAQSGAHVANPAVQVGTNGTFNNFLNVSSVSAANINTSIGQGLTKNAPLGALVVNSVFANIALDGTIPSWFVGTATTTGAVFRGRLWVLAMIVPIYLPTP